MKKKILRILLISIILGIALLFIQEISRIESKEFMSYYWKIGILVLLIIIVIITLYFIFYTKKINNNKKLFNEKRYDEYIVEMEKLLEKCKNKAIRNVITINLSAGYIENKEYDKALSILNSIDIKDLKDEKLRLPFNINLAITYFRLENYNDFEYIYLDNIDLFEKYKNSKDYGESISQLDIFYNIVEGKYREANKLLNNLFDKYNESVHMEDYIELKNYINGKMK